MIKMGGICVMGEKEDFDAYRIECSDRSFNDTELQIPDEEYYDEEDE